MDKQIVIINFSMSLIMDDVANGCNNNGSYFDTQKESLIHLLRKHYPDVSIGLIGLNNNLSLKYELSRGIKIFRLPYVHSLLYSIIPFNISSILCLIYNRPLLIVVYSGSEIYPYLGAIIYSKLFITPYLLCLRNPPEYICSFHHFSFLRRSITRILEYIGLKYSTKIIHISEKSKQSLKDNPELYSKSIVMQSSPNTFFYQPNINGTKENDKFIFTYWGVVDKLRDLEVVIRGFVKAKELDPTFNAVFSLFGDGDDKNRLSDLINELKISNVYFMGCHTQDTLCNYLKDASVAVIAIPPKDIFQYSSPLKLAEAVTLGLPIIASDIEPNRIVKDNNLGILCEHTIDGYAVAFLQFWNFSQSELSSFRKNCNDSKYMFNPDNVLKDVLKVFDDEIKSKYVG